MYDFGLDDIDVIDTTDDIVEEEKSMCTDNDNVIEDFSDTHDGLDCAEFEYTDDVSNNSTIFGETDIAEDVQESACVQQSIFGVEDLDISTNTDTLIFGTADGDELSKAEKLLNTDDGITEITESEDGVLHIKKDVDLDGDGEADQYLSYNIDEDGLHIEYAKNLNYHYAADINEIEQFNNSDFDNDNVIGQPEKAMKYWDYQGDTNRCALYTQKFVIEDLLDTTVGIDEMVDIAKENGWFTEEAGTYPDDMGKMLEHYNIPYEQSCDNTFDDLVNALQSGDKVIAFVDSDEILYGEEDGIFSPWDQANHAVEVIGVTGVDTDNPMIVLNDPVNPESGCGAMVSVENFMDAWKDGHNYMVRAYREA